MSRVDMLAPSTTTPAIFRTAASMWSGRSGSSTFASEDMRSPWGVGHFSAQRTAGPGTQVPRSASGQLVAASGQIRGLGGVAGQLDGTVVGRARLLAATEPTQQVGARRMVGVVAGELIPQPLHSRQRHLRTVELCDRDGSVEGDDRRGVEAEQKVVQRDD